MNKITAYGIRTFDFIYRMGDEHDGSIVRPSAIRSGGVENFSRVLKNVHGTCVRTVPESIGDVSIVMSKDGNKRSLMPHGWPKQHRFIANPESDWHHLMYLDTCVFDDRFFHSTRGNGIISGDVVSDLRSVMHVLPRLDFLFVSMENCGDLIGQAAQLVHKAVIVHGPNCVAVVSPNRRTHYINVRKINDIDPIGAGDYFAAFFAHKYLETNRMNDAAECAAAATTNYLEENHQWEN